MAWLLRSYPCVYCGPPGKCDFSFEVADNDMEAYAIMDNFKVALANRRAPLLPCPALSALLAAKLW